MKEITSGMFLLLALFITACQPGETNSTNTDSTAINESRSSPQSTVDLAAEGRLIFATNCMICHKETGKGGQVTINGRKIDPDDLTTEKMKAMTDDKLIGYVTNGVEEEGMPAFREKLTPEEIQTVVAHVRTLQAQ